MIKTFMRDDIITISLISFHLNPHAFWMSPAPNRFVFLVSCRSHSTYHTSFPAIIYYYYYVTCASTAYTRQPSESSYSSYNIILHLYSLRYIIWCTTWGKRLSHAMYLHTTYMAIYYCRTKSTAKYH